MDRNTSRVDLDETWVCEVSALTVSLDGCRTVTTHGIGRKEIGVTVSAGGKADSVSAITLQLAGNEVLCDDTTATAVDDHNILNLGAGVKLHGAVVDLLHKRGVGTEQKLLTGLSLSVERTADLHTTEGTVGKHAAIFTGERNALGHTLVDNVCRHLRKTIDVGLTCTVVTALDSIVEQAVNGVAVVLVVLCSVDTSLRSDRVCTARRVLNAEIDDVEAHLAKRSGCRGTSQTRTNDDDVELTFVGRVYKFLMSLIVGPFFGQRAFRNS